MKLLLILCFFTFLPFQGSAKQDQLNYHLVDVYDGDTVKLEDNHLPAPFNKISIRIYGIDAPELRRSSCSQEHSLAIEARDYLKKLLTENRCNIEYMKWDKYGGRIVAKIFVNHQSVSDLMIKKGYAYPYFGKKKRVGFFCQ